MKEAIKIIRGDKCPKCDKDRCVEIYDIRNRPIRYTYLLDAGKTDNLVNLQLNHMRCNACHTEFYIDWSSLRNPRPLYKAFNEGFLNKFNKS